MNNDLEQFTIDKIKHLTMAIDQSAFTAIRDRLIEEKAMAEIALKALQAKPVGRIEGWNDHEDIYIIQWFGNQQDLPKGAALYTTPQPAHTDMSGFDLALAGSEVTVITNYFTPDGWKLVPIEPTEDMLNAGCRFASEHNTKGSWSQMLAAAPKPESE
ncbi:hypothetical protein [Rahnella bonaserana]